MASCNICLLGLNVPPPNDNKNDSGGSKNSDICSTKCGHLFHSKCINDYFRKKLFVESCPACDKHINLWSLIKVFHDWSFDYSSYQIDGAEKELNHLTKKVDSLNIKKDHLCAKRDKAKKSLLDISEEQQRLNEEIGFLKQVLEQAKNMKEPEETREIKQEIEGLMTITKEYMKISALIKQGVNINSSISNLLNPMYYGRESFEQDSKIMRKTIEDYKTVDERLRNEMIAHQNSKMEYKKFKKRSDLYFKSIDSIEAHSNNNKLDFGLSGLHKTLMKYYNGIEMVNGSELPSYTTDQPIQESTFSLKNQQFLEEIKYQERYIPF